MREEAFGSLWKNRWGNFFLSQEDPSRPRNLNVGHVVQQTKPCWRHQIQSEGSQCELCTYKGDARRGRESGTEGHEALRGVTIQGLFFIFCPPSSFPDHIISHLTCHMTCHLTHHLTHHLTNHLIKSPDLHQDTGSYCLPNWDTLLFSFLIVLLPIVLRH